MFLCTSREEAMRIFSKNKSELPKDVQDAFIYLLEETNHEYSFDSRDLPYPYNLVAQVLGSYEPEGDVLSKDQFDGLEFAIQNVEKHLPKIAEALRLRFVLLMTYAEIGKAIGVNDSTASAYVAKGVRMLKHPSYKNYIKYGYKVFSKKIFDEEYAKHQAEVERAREEARRQIEEAREETRRQIEESKEMARKAAIDMKAADPAFLRTLSIVALNTSVRSYHALSKAGVYTVSSILALGRDGLMNIHNLGKKSFEEVCGILRSLGFVVFDDGTTIM